MASTQQTNLSDYSTSGEQSTNYLTYQAIQLVASSQQTNL
jgi:hypothetical protein